MKKAFALLLTLAMVLSLAACGAKEEKPAETPAETPAAEETGSVSLAVGNVVQRDINLDLLSESLTKLLYSHATQDQITEVVHH